jgi:hypothetical protein
MSFWLRDADERRVAWMLVGIILFEGVWVVVTFVAGPMRLVHYLGFTPAAEHVPGAWIAAAIVAAAYVAAAASIRSVRSYMWRPGALKVLVIVAAVMAAVLEEIVLRKWPMDYLHARGDGIAMQVLATGAVFGAAHLVWGLLSRNISGALHAVVATTALGAALGVVYLLAGRNLAPCVVAHFVIATLIEPGMLMAAVRQELGARATAAGASTGV